MRFCPQDGTATSHAPDATPQDPLIGQVIDDRYRVERSIGEGGMGVVYLATHVVLGRQLALKVLRGEMAKDADVVQRFIQEAQTSSAIGHPNIIDISDFGRLPDGAVYFVMEYLDGEPLTALIERGGSVALEDTIVIVRQVASALSAAHARGIVHRDLKPDNIFLVPGPDARPSVTLLDFGIAKVGGANSKLTKTGMVFGTPHYMSPEQAAGQMVDARTDIYALGVILYEMATGTVPFDSDTFMGILSKHMFEPPIPPTQLEATREEMGSLEPVILKALAKKPEDRYATMDEVLSDLDKLWSGQILPKLPSGPSGVSPPTDLGPVLSHSGGGRSRPLLAVVLMLLVAIVIGGGAGAMYALGRGERADGEADVEEEGGVDGEADVPPRAASAPGSATEDPAPAAPAADLPVGRDPTQVAPAAAPMVRIESEPSGAAVYADGAIIGNTPLELPRPREAGVRRALELRAPEHETGAIVLTTDTGDRILVTLDRERSARRVRRPARPRSTAPEPVADTPSTPAPPPPMMPVQPTSEVVDPWAD